MYAGLEESIDPWVHVELLHSKSKNQDIWGRKIIQAIDIDDCIALFESFTAKIENPKSTNPKHIDVQTNIYGYGEYLWTRKIHQYIGDTALHLAMKGKKMKCIHMLLVLKADYTITNEALMTADDLCEQIFNTNIVNLRYDSEKYIINNLDPNLFHRLPDDAIYRSLKKEAWDLMCAGRILYSELPASFQVVPKNGLIISNEDKRSYLSFNMDPKDLEPTDDCSLPDRIKGRYPKAKNAKPTSTLRRQWVTAKDDRGKTYYYDQTTGDSTYQTPADLHTSTFIPLLSPEEQAKAEYDTWYERFAHDEAHVTAFKTQCEAAKNNDNEEHNTPAKKLTALKELHTQPGIKKDGVYYARYLEMVRLKELVDDKVTQMKDRNQRNDVEERRGYSITPGAVAVGDVWSRGTISDIIFLIQRQTERRKHAEAESGIYTAKGLSLLGSMKQSTASARIAEHEQKLVSGDKVSFQDIPKELQNQEGIKRLKFLKMGQVSLIKDAVAKTHSVPLSTKDNNINAQSPSKRLTSSVSDRILFDRSTAVGSPGRGMGGNLGSKQFNAFNDTLTSAEGMSPGGRSLVYDPLNHMHTVDYNTAREITSLSTLSNLKYMKIGDIGVTDLSAVLFDDQIIRSINLSNARISSVGVIALCGVLPSMSALTYLDLSSNVICDEGASVLASVILHEECMLEKLSLAGNRIKWKGCMEVIEAVFESPLKWISIHNNLLNKEDIEMMQKMLEELNYGIKPEVERTVTQRRLGKNRPVRFAGKPLVYTKKPSMHLSRDINVRASKKGDESKGKVDDEEKSKQSDEGENEDHDWDDDNNNSDGQQGYVAAKTIVL